MWLSICGREDVPDPNSMGSLFRHAISGESVDSRIFRRINFPMVLLLSLEILRLMGILRAVFTTVLLVNGCTIVRPRALARVFEEKDQVFTVFCIHVSTSWGCIFRRKEYPAKSSSPPSPVIIVRKPSFLANSSPIRMGMLFLISTGSNVRRMYIVLRAARIASFRSKNFMWCSAPRVFAARVEKWRSGACASLKITVMRAGFESWYAIDARREVSIPPEKSIASTGFSAIKDFSALISCWEAVWRSIVVHRGFNKGVVVG